MRIPLIALFAVLSLATRDASACKCLNKGLEADLQQSDAVFVGQVTHVDIRKFVVAVDGVWKGSPAKIVTVRSDGDGTGNTSCSAWTRPIKGQRWVMFLNGAGPTYLRGSFCRNTQRATDAVMAEMIKKLGAPKPL